MTEIKNERKKVTLETLIKRKMELKEKPNMKVSGTVFIPSLDGDIEYEVHKSDVIDFKDTEGGEAEAQTSINTLIYTMVKSPDLSDKELQKELGCVEPTDIVPLLFTEGEQIDLMNLALEKTGFKAGVVTEVKN